MEKTNFIHLLEPSPSLHTLSPSQRMAQRTNRRVTSKPAIQSVCILVLCFFSWELSFSGRQHNTRHSGGVQAMSAKDLCAGYTSQTYDLMKDDAKRTEAYRQAIERMDLRDKVVLDIGCGALALLAIFAAERWAWADIGDGCDSVCKVELQLTTRTCSEMQIHTSVLRTSIQ